MTETSLAPAEDSVPAQQTSEEAIVATLLPGAGRAHVSQYEHRALIDKRKSGEVAGMHARGFQDLLELFAEATWSLSVIATIESAGTAYYLPERKRKIILEETTVVSLLQILQKTCGYPTYTKACGNRTLAP